MEVFHQFGGLQLQTNNITARLVPIEEEVALVGYW